MGQEVRRGETPLVRALVTVACMDGTGRPQRLPDTVRAALESLA